MEKLIYELLESINPVTEMEVDGILSTWHNVRKLKDSAMLPRSMRGLNQEKLQNCRSSTDQI